MDNTVREVLEFVQANDVKFVRLIFCDLTGQQKNISIMPDELERALSNGVSFDGTNINGFSGVVSNLVLHPDPSTLSVLPWRPQQGRVVRFFCNITTPDGVPFSCDSRKILSDALKRCKNLGYSCKIGTECEFYLFKTDENGEPLDIPMDNGTYLDVSPLDKGENVRREICLTLEEMGMKPENSHHERGPGQNEIDFQYNEALSAAEDFLSFRQAVKAIAARNGLFASFMPKPLMGKSGSGLHINLSLFRNGMNIFNDPMGKYKGMEDSFIAGIMAHIAEITFFLNPLINSYERFGSFEAPKYVSWSKENRGQLIRVHTMSGDKNRIELRSPDSAINPYLAFALIIEAGLDGIEKGMSLRPALDIDLISDEQAAELGAESLPTSLEDAMVLARESEFVKRVLGEQALGKFIEVRSSELCQFTDEEGKQELYKALYFEKI